MFWCVLYYLGAFGTFWLRYNTLCQMDQTGAKVRATKSHRNFSQRTHRSTPLDPKLTFWCVLYYLGAFGTAWLPYETQCKMGRTRARVRGTKSRRTFRNECTRSTPLNNILMFWCVCTIWVHSGLFSCLMKLVAKRAELVQKFVPRSGVGIFRNECT